jgi:hypothetical protein
VNKERVPFIHPHLASPVKGEEGGGPRMWSYLTRMGQCPPYRKPKVSVNKVNMDEMQLIHTKR